MVIEVISPQKRKPDRHDILMDVRSIVRSISWPGGEWIELYNVQPRGMYLLWFRGVSDADSAYNALRVEAIRNGNAAIIVKSMEFIDEDDE